MFYKMKLFILIMVLMSCTFVFADTRIIKNLPYQFSTRIKPTKDSTDSVWINDFRIFRNAVYQNDIKKTKTFFSFPILDSSNEIWTLVLTDKEKQRKKIDYEKIIPFTEIDFDKYFNKLD